MDPPKQPRAIEPKDRIKVITLSTDTGPALDNWKYTATKLGYDVTVLGVGLKWGGWDWRTKQYLAAVRALTPGTLVLLVDGNDILFVRGPSSLYRAYKSIGVPLVFGGEATCCVGKFEATKMNGERHRAISTIDSRLPENRWKFPNAGCIMGTREAVMNALDMVKDEPDDQAGHLEQYLEDPAYLQLDWGHGIVGNINRPGTLFCVDTSVVEDKDSVELTYWDKVSVGDLRSEAIENGKDPTIYKDSFTNALYRNKETGGVPCVLHFAGKNVRSYNLVGATLYGNAFRPVLPDQPPSVGKSALLNIASIWKS